jgi:hypothetical protein
MGGLPWLDETTYTSVIPYRGRCDVDRRSPMLIIGLLLRGEVRALTAANPSCPAQRGPAHGADCPKDACRMVVQGRDSLQHVPKLLFMKYPG